MVDKIKKLCKEKKIAVSKMEEDLQFSRGYIYKLDESVPSITNAKKIADYLGIQLDELTN